MTPSGGGGFQFLLWQQYGGVSLCIVVKSSYAHILSTRLIELFQLLIEDGLFFEALVCFVQHKRGPSIFDRVVRIDLDILMQYKPR